MVYQEVETNQNVWIPEKEGEVLEGEIINENEGAYGKQFNVKRQDGSEILTPSHKVLQAKIDSLTTGDRIRITFKGLEPAKMKGWKPTRVYKVEVDRPDEEKV